MRPTRHSTFPTTIRLMRGRVAAVLLLLLAVSAGGAGAQDRRQIMREQAHHVRVQHCLADDHRSDVVDCRNPPNSMVTTEKNGRVVYHLLVGYSARMLYQSGQCRIFESRRPDLHGDVVHRIAYCGGIHPLTPDGRRDGHVIVLDEKLHNLGLDVLTSAVIISGPFDPTRVTCDTTVSDDGTIHRCRIADVPCVTATERYGDRWLMSISCDWRTSYEESREAGSREADGE